jgi:ketopantoate reductase
MRLLICVGAVAWFASLAGASGQPLTRDESIARVDERLAVLKAEAEEAAIADGCQVSSLAGNAEGAIMAVAESATLGLRSPEWAKAQIIARIQQTKAGITTSMCKDLHNRPDITMHLKEDMQVFVQYP